MFHTVELPHLELSGYHRLRGHVALECLKVLLARPDVKLRGPQDRELIARAADMTAQSFLEELGIPHPDA